MGRFRLGSAQVVQRRHPLILFCHPLSKRRCLSVCTYGRGEDVGGSVGQGRELVVGARHGRTWYSRCRWTVVVRDDDWSLWGIYPERLAAVMGHGLSFHRLGSVGGGHWSGSRHRGWLRRRLRLGLRMRLRMRLRHAIRTRGHVAGVFGFEWNSRGFAVWLLPAWPPLWRITSTHEGTTNTVTACWRCKNKARGKYEGG